MPKWPDRKTALFVHPSGGILTSVVDQLGGDSRSPLWTGIAGDMVLARANLANFRSPGGANGRLAHWDPREPTFRWFKSYLQLAAASTPPDELEILRVVGPHDLGHPLVVTVETDEAPSMLLAADLDYLYAAEEVAFVRRSLPGFESIRTVCELGAGFGRTAHTLLSLAPSIDRYTIVDLPETLLLSKAYLQATMPDSLMSKLAFVEASQTLSTGGDFDLFIQIDGLQEMNEETIDDYLKALAAPSKHCYLSNPVGKYDPTVAGLGAPDLVEVQHALRLGKSRDMVDPWDESTLRNARTRHAAAYCPPNHAVMVTEVSRLRPFYLHALYGKREPST